SAYAVLGRPLSGHDLVVLDSRGVACPIDIPGELALAGEGASPRPTGDRARLRADGSLEWWGRTDGRVRLRGLSADLGEIRSRLGEHPALAEAEVLVRPDRRGQERLVAYVVRRPAADYTDSELRRHLRRSLPEPMIPSHFVELKALARDASGVVDRRGLPVPASLGAAGVREEPRTDEERLLVELWQEALGVTGVSVRDNFFDMGGHSLLSLQVVARIEERTGKKIKPRLLLLSSLEQVAGELARA
ncbi:MAG TPA: phosphopantetheine-binding protein, partial [Vicinamibacteria bacterium]|nr:phosphopantetheine-binding protein [Vicinamibacteria bacterium]